MLLLPHRSLLAIAAVVDIATHSRPRPVAAKMLAARQQLPPRHLETLLQALVHANILKGVRGPLGGYELARERRRISVADIVRAANDKPDDNDDGAGDASGLVDKVIAPLIAEAGAEFLQKMDQVSVHDLCAKAVAEGVYADPDGENNFHI